MFFLEDTWYLSQYIYNLPKITCTFIYIYNICTYIHNILKSYIYNLPTYLPTDNTYIYNMPTITYTIYLRLHIQCKYLYRYAIYLQIQNTFISLFQESFASKPLSILSSLLEHYEVLLEMQDLKVRYLYLSIHIYLSIYIYPFFYHSTSVVCISKNIYLCSPPS